MAEPTKEQLARRLSSLTKDELVSALASHVTKDDLMGLVEARLKKDELASVLEERREQSEERPKRQQREEKDSPPAPSIQGRRVRVDVGGLPMLGVFLGPGSSAAGTIVAADPERGELTVWLDAGFDGQKAIVVPPERVVLV